MIICPNCQKQLPDGANFCDGCGTQFQQTVICPQCGSQNDAQAPFCQTCGVQFAAPAESKPAFNLDVIKNLPKKTLALIGGAAVAVVAIVLIICIIAGSGMPNYAIYRKDGELCYNDLGDKKTGVEIADDANSAFLSPDGKTILYTKDGGLYYRNINKKNSEATKWLSNYSSLKLSENGKVATYIKDDALYQKKLGADEAVKVASDVHSFTVTPNGGQILFVNKDSDVYYVKKAGKEPVKIVSGVDEYGVEFISENLKTIVYLKDSALCVATAGKESEKIASDVTSVYAYDLKNIYYVTKEEVKEGETVVKTTKSLSFYNGKTSVELAKDNYDGIEDTNLEKKAIIYKTSETSEDNTITTVQYFLAMGKKTYSFFEYTKKYTDGKLNSYDYITDTVITENGKKVYYLVKTNNPDAKVDSDKPAVGDLYEANLGSKIASAKKYDNDVYALNNYTAVLNKPLYSKEYKKTGESPTYDLYLSKKLVSNDVEDVMYSNYAEALLLKSDDSLFFFKNKKVLITNEDYSSLNQLPSGDILYITDISETSGKGDLMLFNGKKSKKIDSDVSSVQSIMNLEDQYKDNAHLYVSAPGVKTEGDNQTDEY